MSELLKSKLLVLYADDDPDDIHYVSESLLEHSNAIQLLTFPDAESLLSSILTGKIGAAPCLVILDINMPRLSGKEALTMLRNIEEYKSIPVVLFSTSNSPHDGRFASQFGAELIPKPLNENQMQLITKKFLERCVATVKGK